MACQPVFLGGLTPPDKSGKYLSHVCGLRYLSWEAVCGADTDRVVILDGSATEDHGPDKSLDVDALVCELLELPILARKDHH